MHQAIQKTVSTARTGNEPLAALNSSLQNLSASETLEYAITDLFPQNSALVSSFGSASVVLLHLVSKIAPDLPVLFIDTGKLFKETLEYRNEIQHAFQLTNIQTIEPDQIALTKSDPNGALWFSQPDACCAIRKVAPLTKALAPYSAWISGRKRYQNGQRQTLSIIEPEGDKFKINPLAFWTPRDVENYINAHQLPRHPLIAIGYPSIGCAPCTSQVRTGEDERAGRWRGQEKTECGIHFTTNQQADPQSAPADSQRRIKSWA